MNFSFGMMCCRNFLFLLSLVLITVFSCQKKEDPGIDSSLVKMDSVTFFYTYKDTGKPVTGIVNYYSKHPKTLAMYRYRSVEVTYFRTS